MKKSLKLSLGSVVVAGAMGALLLPAATASAADTLACPTGTDAIDVPYAFTADFMTGRAATASVVSGTTLFATMTVTPGWRGEVKSDGSDGRTEVRFSESITRDRVELRYEPGRMEIK